MKKMKHLLILLMTLVLLVGLTACANEYEPAEPEYIPEVEETIEPPEEEEAPPEVEEPDEPEEVEEETPAGSQITGAIHRIEYGDNVVYLFGTIHAYREGWTPLADVVEDAMARADVFVAEISSEEMALVEARVPEIMFLPDGQTWADYLPEEAFDHFVAMTAEWGVGYEEANTISPSFLIQLLELQLAFSLVDDLAMGLDASVDAYVMGVAEERGLPTLGLESADQQIEILYNPPFEVVVAQVMAFGTPDEALDFMMDTGTLADMADWYETNNFQAFQDQFILSFEDVDCLATNYMRETLINFRSTYYAQRIAELLRETEEPTTFFVAVGISHVVRARGGVEGLTDIVEQLELLDIIAEPIY